MKGSEEDCLRFYIVSQAVSESIWAKIRYFIEDVKNLHGKKKTGEGFKYFPFEIFSQKVYSDTLKTFGKQKPGNFGSKVESDFFCSERGKIRLRKYKILDFVIILKLTKPFIDFKQIIPFFIIHEKFPNTSLGINLRNIKNYKDQNRILFSLGQFLWNFKFVKSRYTDRLIFSITEETPGDPSSAKVKRLPTERGVVLKRFSPLIEINEQIFDRLFVNTLSKTISSNPHTEGDGRNNPLSLLDPIDFEINEENVDIKNLFLRRYIDFKSKVETEIAAKAEVAAKKEALAEAKIKREGEDKETIKAEADSLVPTIAKIKIDRNQLISEIENLLFNSFKKEPFITFYLFIMLLDQLMQEKAGTDRRGRKWLDALIQLNDEDKILKYILLIRRYATGLREVAENIIFHTDAQRGYFYFVLKPTKEYSVNLDIDNKVLIDKKQYKDLYLKLFKLKRRSLKPKKELPKRFLEVVLVDMANIGIIQRHQMDSSIKDFGSEGESLEALNLEDFYVGKFSKLPGLSHLDMRYLAQLGLKTFAAIIKNKRGYFEVETNVEEGKQRLIYFRNIKALFPPKPEKKCFYHGINRFAGDGTHYDILLPISEDLIEDEGEARATFEVKSFIELFEKWLHSDKNREPVITEFKDFDTFSVVNYEKKVEFVENTGKKIVEHYQKENESTVLSVNFDEVLNHSIDFSTFIKILTYVQLANNINSIIIYNVDNSSFELMMNQLNLLASFGKFWNKNSWIYLYDKKGVPFILNGETVGACEGLNKIVELHYGYRHYFLDAEDIFKTDSSSTSDHYILPYEVLVQTKEKTGLPASLFEKNVYHILSKEVEDREFGVLIKDAHMRLGSKIHLDNFYEGEVLFRNNFYVERFAYFLARDIYKRRRGKNRILLLGYGSYSEMFVNRIKHILNGESLWKDNRRGKNICPAYFICNDVEELKWQRLEQLKELDTEQVFDFALVIPVASSLTTNYKIMKNFEKKANSKTKRKDFFQEDKLIFNASIILIRDELKDEPTKREETYNWRKINIDKRTVETKNFKEPIYFFISEAGGWNSPTKCKLCFPDIYGNRKVVDEQILLETRKASINPRLVLDWPKVDIKDINYKEEFERLYGLKNCIKYGHIRRNTSHHLYYIDTLKFFETHKNKKNIRKWLEGLKEEILGKNDAYNIIVSVLHYSNTGFINLVNDTIFNGVATIIILDLESEYRDNVIAKYSYLNDIKGKIRFHYVDDAVLSGSQFILARSFVSSIFEHFGHGEKEKSNIEIFSSTIVLLNRLSGYRKKDSLQLRRRFPGNTIEYTTFKSYINLFVPPIRDPKSFCFICNARKEYERLRDSSILDKLKFYYIEKVNNSTIREEFENKYAEERFFYRFQLIHKIYYHLSKNRERLKENGFGELIEDIWKLRENTKFKIDIVKVLSSPPLNHYKNIQKDVFKKLISELFRLITKAPQEIEALDFNLLLTLMKQLVLLNSNFILRKENIKRIWLFYAKYKKRFIKMYEDLYNVNKSGLRECLDKIAQLVNEEKKLANSEGEEEEQVLRNRRIEYLEKDIKKIAGAEMPFLRGQVENLMELLNLTEPLLLTKTVYNFFEFKFTYVTLIKMLIYKDEAKSLWLEYLFRTGHELPEDFSLFCSIPENKTYNNLHGMLTGEVKEAINKEYKEFFVLVKLENVAILQKGLKKFITEPFHIQLEEKIKQNNYRLNDLELAEIFTVFMETINKEYYYEYLVRFVSDDNQNIYRKIFDVYLLKSYLEVLNHVESGVNLKIDEELGEIAKMLTKIMDADKSFFTIKKIRTKETELYTIGRYNICSTELPFELTNDYFTYRMLNDGDEESKNTFVSPSSDKWEGKEKEKNSNIISIRFFHSKNLHERKWSPTGAVTFLYKDKYDDKKRAEKKENIRYVLLIIEEIKSMLEKNFDNDNLNDWIEAKKKEMFSTEYIRKIYHGAHTEIKDLREEIDKGRDGSLTPVEQKQHIDYAFACSWIVDSQVSIGHLYAKITLDKLNDVIDPTQGPFDLKDDIFDDEFKKILEILAERKRFIIKYDLKPRIKTPIYKHYLKLFIIEIVMNYSREKYMKKGSMYFKADESGYLIVESVGSTSIVDEHEINKSINSAIPTVSGIGLFTINKIIYGYCKKNVEIKIDPSNKIFKIIIPIN
jgi:hypothetical protein